MVKMHLRHWGELASDEDHYSRALSLISRSYYESFYKRAVQTSPALNKLDPQLSAILIKFEKEFNHALRKTSVIAAALFLIGFFLSFGNSPYAQYIDYFSILAIYSTIFFTLWSAIRLLNEERAAFSLFSAIRKLERKSDSWRTSRFRDGIASTVERAARYVERIPLGRRGIAPSVRRDAIRSSKAKAQALRQLETSILIPSTLTMAELINRLQNDLRSIANDKWYELPEGQLMDRVRPRWISTILVTASVLIIGLAIFIPTLAGKAGPEYSLVAALLLSVGLSLLNIAGLSTGYLGDILKEDNK